MIVGNFILTEYSKYPTHNIHPAIDFVILIVNLNSMTFEFFISRHIDIDGPIKKQVQFTANKKCVVEKFKNALDDHLFMEILFELNTQPNYYYGKESMEYLIKTLENINIAT